MKKSIFTVTAILFSALLSVLISGCQKKSAAGYEKLFDSSSVHDIQIVFEDGKWEKLKANALEKKNYHADIIIDGEAFKDVSISTKGSSSLRNVFKKGDVRRFSLKIKFNKYNKEQTYHGLDILNLNNNLTDPSQMKDFLAYQLFRKTGVPAPLSSYADVTVNGELYGLFHAVEDIRQGFLDRNFQGKGDLYKPEAKCLSELNESDRQNVQKKNSTDETPVQMSLGLLLSKLDAFTYGADLRYTDDNPDSYCEIFDSAETDIDEADQKRVIAALKKLSEGDIKGSVDGDEIIRYFAVHNFTANYDSSLSKMDHNFYLYENDGILRLFPWDYNYDAFYNDLRPVYSSFRKNHFDVDIDNPLMVPEESRPMWSWIKNNPKYLKQYHEVVSDFLKKNMESNWAESEVDRINSLTRDDVEADPNRIYSMEEYDAAVQDLKVFFQERTKAVREMISLR